VAHPTLLYRNLLTISPVVGVCLSTNYFLDKLKRRRSIKNIFFEDRNLGVTDKRMNGQGLLILFRIFFVH